jgi:membrane-anchored protein YejM (alkaline phosphatase superfamily)
MLVPERGTINNESVVQQFCNFGPMKTASVHEIKNELQTLDAEQVAKLCLRLAKFKKENKELLTYLLFESHNEQAYVESVKEAIDELFTTLPNQNVYLIKKVLRKILRFVNRQLKYSGVQQTEVELRIYFCSKVKEARIPFTTNTVLFNLYQQQLNKINSTLAKLPEDLQSDYQHNLETIL